MFQSPATRKPLVGRFNARKTSRDAGDLLSPPACGNDQQHGNQKLRAVIQRHDRVVVVQTIFWATMDLLQFDFCTSQKFHKNVETIFHHVQNNVVQTITKQFSTLIWFLCHCFLCYNKKYKMISDLLGGLRCWNEFNHVLPFCCQSLCAFC